MTFEDKTVIVISQLRADRDRLQNAIDNIRAEIAEYEKTCKVWSANQLKDDVKRCTSCINGTFGRINEIFDRHLGSEVQADENWID